MTAQQGKRQSFFAGILLMIPVPWVYILFYLLGVGLQLLFPLHLFPEKYFLTIQIIGAALFLIGAYFAGWSLLIFHKAKTTTIPGESSRNFIQHGPYRLSRNPMYVSLLLAYLGEAGILVQVWPIIVLPLLLIYVNNIVIPLEESILIRDYREEYADYCTRVRRWV